MINMVEAIWDSGVETHTQHGVELLFKLNCTGPVVRPGPISVPKPKIFIAGVNPYLCQLAGELCEGFHIHPFHSIRYLDTVVLPNISKGLQKAGRDRAQIQLSTTAFVVTGRNDEEIEAAKGPVKQQIAFYASTPAYLGVLDVHGWADVGRRLTELSKQGKWAEMASEITDEMLAEYAVIARRDDLVDKLKAKYTGYLDRLGFYFPFDRTDGFWREVIRAFNG